MWIARVAACLLLWTAIKAKSMIMERAVSSSASQITRASFLLEMSTPLPLVTATMMLGSFTDVAVAAATLGRDVDDQDIDTIKFALRFLPVGGCWAVRIVLQGFSYYAVIDTGSPFWTAPRRALSYGVRTAKLLPTKEQYGDTMDVMEWRRCKTVLGRPIIVGIPSESTVQSTGGVFAGLIAKDDKMPTFLDQIMRRNGGCSGFTISFENEKQGVAGTVQKEANDPSLLLYRNATLSIAEMTTATTYTTTCHELSLFDLSPFGPNLYHYAVLCNGMTLQLSDGSTRRIDPIRDLSRPLVAVIDTGLTGCVFDAPLWDGLRISNRQHLVGMTVSLRTNEEASSERSNPSPLEVQSVDRHFYAMRIELPWWYGPEHIQNTHPYIVALGNTFWTHPRIQSLSVDIERRRGYIGLIK